MKQTYTIGEVEKITGISKDRLRNYDKQEILQPAKEDNNQYRQYNENDIIDILGIEYFRRMDLGIKDIKAIKEQGNIEFLLEEIQNKKEKVQETIKTLQYQWKILNSTEEACKRIQTELGKYSVRRMPAFRALGKMSQTTSFEEYTQLHECKKDEAPILKSMMRKISFNMDGILDNEVLIVEDNCQEDETVQAYEKCLYTVVAEKADAEDIMGEQFYHATNYMREQQYEPLGIVYIKPMLIGYPLKELTTYLEIYVPLK